MNSPARDSKVRSAQADLWAAEGALRKALRRRDDKAIELAAHNASKGLAHGIDKTAHCPVRQRLHDDIEAMERVIEHLEDRVSLLEASWARLQGTPLQLQNQES